MKARFRVSPEKARELIALWQDEDASYYGKPGVSSGYRILRESESLFFGVSPNQLHKEDVWYEDGELSKREMVFPFCSLGLTHLPGGFSMWFSKNGNKAAVHPLTGEVRIWSRRHGIPIHTVSCLRGHEIGKISVESDRKDLAWWETTHRTEEWQAVRKILETKADKAMGGNPQQIRLVKDDEIILWESVPGEYEWEWLWRRIEEEGELNILSEWTVTTFYNFQREGWSIS